MMNGWLVIGISGVTCSGKTTLAKRLNETFPHSIYINQDYYFLPPDDLRHKHIDELNHHNWDIITSLDMEKMHTDVLKLLEPSNNVICGKNDQFKTRILIIDGFLIFNYKPIADLCHMKYFLTLTKEQCWKRRKVRLYDPPDVPGYFDKIAWPEYITYKGEIENDDELHKSIIFIDGMLSIDDIFQKVFNDTSKNIRNLCDI